MSVISSLVNPHLASDSFLWQAKSGAPGVLLLHGFTATPAEMLLLADWLHSRGFSVYAPLLPGHGLTPQALNACRWQDWTQAVDQALSKLQAICPAVAVCGESMGSLLTLYLAETHPELAVVVLMAPALELTPRWLKALIPLVSHVKPYIHKRPGPPSAADARWQGYAVYPTRAFRQLFALQGEARRHLNAIRQPLLILQGRLDRSVYPGVPAAITAGVRSSVIEIHWLEHSGHCVAIDAEWEQTANLVERFINQWMET